jgi:putative bacteriocin export ABC transporter (lactococcin 972 group)
MPFSEESKDILCLMEKITKTYQMGDIYVEVLKDVNLEIKRGEFVAVMGTSGSGKTTLMNILGCLDVPTSGRYVLAGKEVSNLTDDELSVIRNEHIGFVFQNFYLLSYATVLENILLPTLYIEKQKDNPEKRAIELLRLVGLEERAKFKPTQLSGGQQQRVAIARALINDPELLLCDEPTGQLDSKTASEIIELLKKLNEQGKTLIVVTHDQNIASHAKRIIRINDGVVLD